jgi:hypothetical protein
MPKHIQQRITVKHGKYSKQCTMGRCGVKPRIGGRRVFAKQIAPQGACPLNPIPYIITQLCAFF